MESQQLVIPTTVRIGVTGHRVLQDEPRVRARVRAALQQLDDLLQHTPHTLVIVSPLAEGADRLVAEEVLGWRSVKGGQACLEAVLPLAVDDYLSDFAGMESREAFRALLARAGTVQTLHPTGSREQAYAAVGRHIVQHCDVLIAIWSGESPGGAGGTAEVVAYARKVERTLFRINPATGQLALEHHADRTLDVWAHVDAFNAEVIDPHKVEAAAGAWELDLGSQAMQAGIEEQVAGLLRSAHEGLLPHFVRADLLAQHYQNCYVRAGTAVYALAAGAVVMVALQNLFLHDLVPLLWLEVAAMAGILALLMASRRGDWHRKYIDYRFLAERLRAALYLSFADALHLPRSAREASTHGAGDWMTRAAASILTSLPHNNRPDIPLTPLKALLLQTWIRDQAAWFERKGTRHRRRHEQLARAGEVVFAVTLIAAAIHATGWVETLAEHGPLPNLLTFVALGLPAVGAALAGIRTHREYLRTAERYAKVTRALGAVVDRVERAETVEELVTLLQEADVIMRQENQDWRVVIRFRELEPP